ncbi:DUF6868 family protein [Parasedimentitalea psychrophila]|uniref:DUF6868 domain-containing protein n=1 Tax=Parasedimentitalea psychrophila TaxID=2997337 RepID=A0A9Y2L1U8_9RHOB|nr:hypothetical protein [Parasedimentitalea psychrophila]WIY27161.1 hypothetical protein QPJ95_09730 [Parasedimentitalea psychrophila]
MTLATLTTFFGWMTVLNIGFLTITALILLAGREKLAALHGGMFNMETGEVKKSYFNYIATYKILTFVFCLTPYVALKLM